jgi:hypothetical protein
MSIKNAETPMHRAARYILVLSLLSGTSGLSRAQETEEALAAVHEALIGRWEGQVEGVNPVTGEAYTQPDTFTFAITGQDSLDAAWWTDFGLILYEHQGGGTYHARTYGPNGAGFEEDLEVTINRPIDSDGAGTWAMIGWGEMPDGTEIEIRETFAISGSRLSMVAEQRPRHDVAAAYRVIAEAEYERAVLQ